MSETDDQAMELRFGVPSLLWCTRSAQVVRSEGHDKSPYVPSRPEPARGGAPDPGNAISRCLRQESAVSLPVPPLFTVADRPTPAAGARESGPIVVWLQGEHDLSTDEALCRALARAIGLDSTGLVLDLSQVTFIAVSTLRVIVRARQFLLHQSRSLTVRSPSPCARRVMGACGLDDLFGPNPEAISTDLLGEEEGKALGTWVEVPPIRRAVSGKRRTNLPDGGGRLARSGG